MRSDGKPRVAWKRGWSLIGLSVVLGCSTAPSEPERTSASTERSAGAEVTDVPAGAPGAGAPVPGPEEEQLVAEMIAASSTDATRFFAETVFVGPGLWAVIVRSGTLENVGTNLHLIVPTPEGQLELDGRMFRGQEIAVLLSSQPLRDALQALASDAPRAANQDERNIYYRLIPWEIAGEPVTVVGEGSNRMLLDAADSTIIADRAIMWMDLVAPYIR